MAVRRVLRRAAAFAAAGALVGTVLGGLVAPVASAASGYTCSGGVIPPGSYGSITVTGTCFMPSGSVNVQAGLTVGPGAILVAGLPGSPTNVTLTVGGGIQVGGGAMLILGCAPSFGCGYTTSDVVRGGITANGALAVILHGDTIGGGVAITGGGQGYDCAPNAFLTDVIAGGFFPLPAYNTIEDTNVSGGVFEAGVVSCWLGFARNQVNGTVSFMHNSLADPDAMEILSNTINGQLACAGNSPVATNIVDGLFPEPNSVTGGGLGECAGL